MFPRIPRGRIRKAKCNVKRKRLISEKQVYVAQYLIIAKYTLYTRSFYFGDFFNRERNAHFGRVSCVTGHARAWYNLTQAHECRVSDPRGRSGGGRSQCMSRVCSLKFDLTARRHTPLKDALERSRPTGANSQRLQLLALIQDQANAGWINPRVSEKFLS